MHMGNELITPLVGGVMGGAALGLGAHASAKLAKDSDEGKVPLMGVLGAFVFAAQMINFTIPGTGSSGHIGGGLLLAILLGPHAAFLVMASILVLQAFLFADGGLVALGCNIFNLGFFPCYLAYPLVYKPIAGGRGSKARLALGSILAAVIGLQLGSLGVVLETMFSGLTSLPMRSFLLLMQPIHLAIGLGEGLATAAVVGFVGAARPELIGTKASQPGLSRKTVFLGLLALALITAGVLSWFASAYPDGLEWSVQKAAGRNIGIGRETPIHKSLGALQERTALLPDYQPRRGVRGDDAGAPAWPAVDGGTTLAGLIGAGSLVFLGGVFWVGWRLIKKIVVRKKDVLPRRRGDAETQRYAE